MTDEQFTDTRLIKALRTLQEFSGAALIVYYAAVFCIPTRIWLENPISRALLHYDKPMVASSSFLHRVGPEISRTQATHNPVRPDRQLTPSSSASPQPK